MATVSMGAIVSMRRKLTKHVAVAALVVGMALTAVEVPLLDVQFSVAQAQEKKKDRKNSGRETRRQEALSQAAFKHIEAAQLAMEGDNYAAARASLNNILSNPGKYKGIDIATAYKFRGYVNAGADNYGAATKDFESALGTGSLPEWDVLDLRYNLAQLYLANEQYRKALQNLEMWFAQAENPGIGAYFLAAQAYALVDRFTQAENYVERGLAKIAASAEPPQENHLRVASVIYLQREKYSKAKPILEQLVGGYPGKKEYFVQLGAVYQELGQEKNSFAMLALAYDNDFKLTDSETVRLAQLYRLYDYPYKAAKILSKGLNSGTVKKNKKNWEELGNAYFQSREMKKAIQPLRNAAKAAKNGEIYLRLCQTFAQEEEWKNAESNCVSALNKGGLKEKSGSAWLLVGIARYEQDKREPALEAFDKCMSWEKQAADCGKWRRHVQTEIQAIAREERRQEEAEKERIRKQKEQEEEIRRTLQQSEEFADSAEENANGE